MQMRRFMTTMCVLGVLGVGAGVALAATPAANTNFSGSGGNYWNQNGSWARHGTAHFTMLTSRRYYTGLNTYKVYIKKFAGNYSTKCHSTLRVAATFIPVRKDGSFSFSFTKNGARVKISGNFTSSQKANVQYVSNFSGTNTNPSTLNAACATWVHGTARAG
jgi:hypothetical protein